MSLMDRSEHSSYRAHSSYPQYLVDTDWVASALKGRVEAQTLLSSLSASGLAMSLMTYGEIYEGIYYGANPKRQGHGFLAFLREVNVLPLNKQIMKRFARIRGELRAAGNIIPDPDILIASTAIHHKFILVTRNIRHFERIAGITDLSIYQSS